MYIYRVFQKSLMDFFSLSLCKYTMKGVHFVLLPSSVTENFFQVQICSSVVFLMCHAYFRTEVQNRCMDGGASNCDYSAAMILGTLWTSLCTRPKHHPQHPQKVHGDWICDG